MNYVPSSLDDSTLGRDSEGETLRRSEGFIFRNRALVGALLLCLLLCSLSYWRILRATGGVYAYSLDDAYLHMAIARSIAEHGVYGLSPALGFASASSAPLWTFLTAACFKVVGVKVLVPLFLTALSAAVLLVVSELFLRRYIGSQEGRLIALSLIVIGMPMPILIFSGMEHLLHAAFTIAIAGLAAISLANDTFSWRNPTNRLIILLVAVAVLVRFETMFLAAVLAGLFLLRRRFLYAVAIAMAAAIPCVVVGTISVAHGWMWLPNTLLLKAAPTQLNSLRHLFHWAFRFSLVITETPHLLVTFLSLSLVYLWRLTRLGGRGFWEVRQLMLLIGVALTILHTQFAAVGWVFRYEAYLVAFSLLALSSVAGEIFTASRDVLRPRSLPSYAAAAVICVTGIVALYPLADRASKAFAHLPEASENIYEQQYQMARFLHEYYEGSSVAANDVGAINFYADIECVDLVGLFNIDVARKRLANSYSTDDIAREVEKHHSKIAVVYDSWFNGDMYPRLPSSWKRVGKWSVSDDFILGADTVSFYAIQPADEAPLNEHLRAFASQLPASVSQRGAYRGQSD